jgi:hypothetical protein
MEHWSVGRFNRKCDFCTEFWVIFVSWLQTAWAHIATAERSIHDYGCRIMSFIMFTYAFRIGYVHLSGVFGAVNSISCSSSLMPILRMGGSVPLPCLYNFMACKAADPCLLSRWRRRRLFPNLFPSSERCNSVLPHHCLWCGMLQIWCLLLQCILILSK